MIEVCEYQESWPERFEALRRLYVKAMGDGSVDVLAIEHVGSTSVPGLAAKPTIDCDIVVEADRVDAATEVLKSLGFRPLGELGIPLRWAFKEPPDFPSTNTYVIVDSSLSLRNHLAVRDALRNDAGLRERYAAVKKVVAEGATDLDAYGRGKNAMVQEILSAAGLTDAERESINSNNVPSSSAVPRSTAAGEAAGRR